MSRTVVLELSEHDVRELLKLVRQQTKGPQVWRAYWQQMEARLQDSMDRFYERVFAEFAAKRG